MASQSSYQIILDTSKNMFSNLFLGRAELYQLELPKNFPPVVQVWQALTESTCL